MRHRNQKGWAYQFRIASRNLELLQAIRDLVETGSISRQAKPSGPYYRFELAGLGETSRVLEKLLPMLHSKKVLVKEWLEVNPSLA